MPSLSWKRRKRLVFIFAVLFGAVFVSHARAGTMMEHEQKLNTQRSKIEHLETDIRGLLEQKRREVDQKKVQELVRTLGEKHKELVTASKDYDEVRFHVRFKHPEKHETLERKYVRYKLKSLKEMEDEFGLDGKLDRLKARVIATFPPAAAPEKTERSPATHGQVSDPKEEDELTHEKVKLVK